MYFQLEAAFSLRSNGFNMQRTQILDLMVFVGSARPLHRLQVQPEERVHEGFCSPITNVQEILVGLTTS